ncbi:hypothetical protein [Sediminicoccus sp. KRV36]|uniref:hypothetical protein n=1 Tax=Sediminicoccus sp. KRV36 TaxID=3133721 RepID=UPI00200C3629|nr:hypothetical protein [Sediminicoccus rosea]UPY36954.1 hypothetical protein LHU95_22500 [Sediminicoccus rosea]
MAGSPAALLLQTADPVVYRGFLEVTGLVNRAYCTRQGIRYAAHIGIARGCHPWHATFNRILLLKGLLDEGFTGWLLYLDADAYVADLDFDLHGFLASRAHRSILGALGHNKALSDINAGVVFFNFAHQDTALILTEWHRLFLQEVTEEMLAGSTAGWSFAPNDQDLLQRVLAENLVRLWPGIGIEERDVFNSTKASFIRQILRRDAPSLAERMALARRDITRIALAAGLPVPD